MGPARIVRVKVLYDSAQELWQNPKSFRTGLEELARHKLRELMGTALGDVTFEYHQDVVTGQMRLEATWTSRCRALSKAKEPLKLEDLFLAQYSKD